MTPPPLRGLHHHRGSSHMKRCLTRAPSRRSVVWPLCHICPHGCHGCHGCHHGRLPRSSPGEPRHRLAGGVHLHTQGYADAAVRLRLFSPRGVTCSDGSTSVRIPVAAG